MKRTVFFSFLFLVGNVLGCSKMDFGNQQTLPSSSAAVQILSADLAPAVNGMDYSTALAATGGSGTYTWSVNSGTLPVGLALDSQSGAISGITQSTGNFGFTVQVKDAAFTDAPISVKPVTITVIPRLIAAELGAATAKVGTPYLSTLVTVGGVPPYTYSVKSGSLPAGLALKNNIISGVPTSDGSYSATLAISDAGGKLAQTLSVPFTLTVTQPVSALQAAVPVFPSGVAGTVYAPVTLPVSGGVPGYSWSLVSGALPAGLTLSGSTGTITGTPTHAGTSDFVLRVKDSESPAQTQLVAGIIIIAAPPVTDAFKGTRWYVRPDGGTRYSSNRPQGQCDGKGDAAYSGTGVNQHCAFNDVRFLYQDGSYNTGSNQGWVIAGGDIVILRGSIGSGTSYRIGWNNNSAAYEASTDINWGVAGDPYGSGIPTPPSGTAAQPTRILGENYGSCHAQTARTQLHGGFGVSSVVNLNGASYVDMECLDITDFSSCGRSAQTHTCNTNPGSLDDYASTGISQTNQTNHVTLTDVRIHGTAGAGLYGPTGDGNVYSYLDLVGNASSGWNADNGTVGVGSTLVQNFSISWNGCAEEYPLVDALPYADCTDDNSGGYGDGFGTATITGTTPWNVTFDQGTVSYNTQDGLDALHLTGPGSSMTITRVLAYGNMGQQIKVGGANGTAMNNVIVTNCNALRQVIPGTPAGYNSNLSDFCRAADTGIYLATQDGTTTRFDFNTVYTASTTAIEIGAVQGSGNAGTDLIDFRNNIFVGFTNSVATGYVNGGTNDYSNPIYLDYTNSFANAGSVFDHNVTFHPKSSWQCPNTTLKETNAKCVDPGLVDETWHNYGVGTMSPVAGNTTVRGAGVVLPGLTLSISGQTRSNPPTIGAYE